MNFHAAPGSNDPSVIHEAEQLWMDADAHLQKIVDYLRQMMPEVFIIAHGNTDVSVTYDFIKGYIITMEQEHGVGAHVTTMLMFAAALTRLVRQQDRTATSDVLAEIEKEITES